MEYKRGDTVITTHDCFQGRKYHEGQEYIVKDSTLNTVVCCYGFKSEIIIPKKHVRKKITQEMEDQVIKDAEEVLSGKFDGDQKSLFHVETWEDLKDKIYKEESVEHPNHYNNGIEAWDFILSHKMDFLQGNVIKYITRYKHKNGLEDLKKAKMYIDKIIKEEYNEDKEDS